MLKTATYDGTRQSVDGPSAMDDALAGEIAANGLSKRATAIYAGQAIDWTSHFMIGTYLALVLSVNCIRVGIIADAGRSTVPRTFSSRW